MVSSLASRLIALLVSLLALLTGCASDPPIGTAGPPPDIRLGPVVELLRLETSSDHVDALLDGKGNVHVIIAAKTSKEIHHVVVSPDGIVQREPVRSPSSTSAVSAAFDSEGRIHLLLDGKHLVREGSLWTATDPTPWEEVGIEVLDARFVQGKTGLIWAFTVDGKEVGTKGHWDWYAFGGGMGGIIFPWHSVSMKLVMVPESAMAEPLWYVLDPEENFDASNAMPAVDDDGNLHVVYDASRAGMAATVESRYARTDLLPPLPSGEERIADPTTGSKKLYPVGGSPIPWFGPERRALFQATAAVDPASGSLLIVRAHDASFALEHGNWSYPVQLPLSQFWEPKLAPAGGNAFHLMTIADHRVLYLLYAHGEWSAPVELGQADTASGYIWSALDIASDGRNRAFVVWPTTTGIVGRWVDGLGEIQVRTGGSADNEQPGTASIPEHLLDFANGKAELITPGVITGFGAAFDAGSNGALTKSLHDAGQWQTLARVVLKDEYGDNLRWYYLGRAAEGMALCDTAEHYYRISAERSQSFWTRCFSIACYGFRLPEILEERFTAIDALRSAGKCSATPTMEISP